MRHFIEWILAKGFEGVSRIYNAFWDLKLLKPKKAPIPVVSIGNIAIGGVGKTPLTIYLTHELFNKGIDIAIASRGYRSKWENSSHAMRVDPITTTAEECGDEPLLIARKCKDVPVWITKHRIKSAITAAKCGAKLLILDDGMQHRALVRNYEIALLDCKEPLGKEAFFPLGSLRDLPERLKGASLICLMNCVNESLYKAAKEKIANYSLAPVVGFIAKSHLPEFKKVAVLTAIANPERFFNQIRAKGIEIVCECSLRDHSFFKKKVIDDLIEKAVKEGAEAIICTEKDHVKIETPLKSQVPIVPVPLAISPLYNKENWDRALEEIAKLAKGEFP